MTQWEYLAISFDTSESSKLAEERWSFRELRGMHLSQGLDHLGAQGWELLQVVPLYDSTGYYFKRPA